MNLITGATGLVGSYLAKLLIQKGEKVRAIKRTTSDTSLLGNYASQIEWLTGDVLDIPSLDDAMLGVSKVYHCAASISFIPGEVEHMMKVNIEGTANVMNAALNNQVKKVVHVSSIAAFGLPTGNKIIDENYSDPNINKSFWYYKSKQYSEREAWRAAEEGLEVIIVCPGTILGAGWWEDEPNSLFKSIYNGLNFYTTATNSFVDVRDVVKCMYQLMESPITSEKYIVTAENISFKEVMWQMADAMQVKRPSVEAGKLLRTIAWRTEALKTLFTKERPLITKESAQLAAVNFAYSNEKIIKALNYSFIPLNKTIQDTAAAFLKSKQEQKAFGVFD